MGYYAYASYALVAGRWMGALIAKRAIPLGTKIAEYTGPLMTDKQVQDEPEDGNAYMMAARRVGGSEGEQVTIDGTPRAPGENIAGYANYAPGTMANARLSDEARRAPRGHTGQTYVVLRATERIEKGTEIRMDYDADDPDDAPYYKRLVRQGVSISRRSRVGHVAGAEPPLWAWRSASNVVPVRRMCAAVPQPEFDTH